MGSTARSRTSGRSARTRRRRFAPFWPFVTSRRHGPRSSDSTSSFMRTTGTGRFVHPLALLLISSPPSQTLLAQNEYWSLPIGFKLRLLVYLCNEVINTHAFREHIAKFEGKIQDLQQQKRDARRETQEQNKKYEAELAEIREKQRALEPTKPGEVKKPEPTPQAEEKRENRRPPTTQRRQPTLETLKQDEEEVIKRATMLEEKLNKEVRFGFISTPPWPLFHPVSWSTWTRRLSASDPTSSLTASDRTDTTKNIGCSPVRPSRPLPLISLQAVMWRGCSSRSVSPRLPSMLS